MYKTEVTPNKRKKKKSLIRFCVNGRTPWSFLDSIFMEDNNLLQGAATFSYYCV